MSGTTPSCTCHNSSFIVIAATMELDLINHRYQLIHLIYDALVIYSNCQAVAILQLRSASGSACTAASRCPSNENSRKLLLLLLDHSEFREILWLFI